MIIVNLYPVNTLMYNVLKWSDKLEKSCPKCCKIFKVCMTMLGYYALKGYVNES